jgi:hypothetical protein
MSLNKCSDNIGNTPANTSNNSRRLESSYSWRVQTRVSYFNSFKTLSSVGGISVKIHNGVRSVLWIGLGLEPGSTPGKLHQACSLDISTMMRTDWL